MSLEESNIDSTIIYKLGALEALVSSSMRNIENSINRLSTEISTVKADAVKEMTALEIRVKLMEEWKSAIVAKAAGAAAVLTVTWVAFGGAIEKFLGGVFGHG